MPQATLLLKMSLLLASALSMNSYVLPGPAVMPMRASVIMQAGPATRDP